jgi:hypothetical protein
LRDAVALQETLAHGLINPDLPRVASLESPMLKSFRVMMNLVLLGIVIGRTLATFEERLSRPRRSANILR